jgi:hypothetical protein
LTITKVEDLIELVKICKVLKHGNTTIISQVFQKWLSKGDIKIAIAGNHALNDIYATHEFNSFLIECSSAARWQSIAILQELKWYYDTEPTNGLIPHNKQAWGQSFFVGGT